MKKPKLSEMKALWDQATPGDWIVRVHPEKDDFFVEAPLARGEAYGTEIFGDEDYPTKRADAEAIAKAKAYHPHLLELVKRLGEALQPFVGDAALFCDRCCITIESDGSKTHDEKCPIPEARALLLEVKE